MFGCRITAILISLVSVYVVVAKIGVEGFGIWESLQGVSMICILFQTAITGTVLWRISNAYGSRNYDEVHRITRLGTTFFLVAFCLLYPLLCFSRRYIVNMLNIPAEFADTAEWILPNVVGLMVLNGITEVLGAVVSGFQRAGLNSMVQTGALALNNLIAIVGLLLGYGLWSLLMGLFAGFLFSGIIYFLNAHKLAGITNLLPAIPTLSELIYLSKYCGWLLIGSVSMALRDHADKVIIAHFASPLWVGYYGIAVRLASVVLMVCSFFYVPLIAAVGALKTAGDWSDIRNIYVKVVAMIGLFAGVLALLIGGLYDRFTILWIGKAVPEVAPLFFLLLMANVTAVTLTGAGSALGKGIGRADLETYYVIICLILNIALKLILVPIYGATGTVVASTVSWTIGSFFFIAILHLSLPLPRKAAIIPFLLITADAVFILATRSLLAYCPMPSGRLAAFISIAIIGPVLIGGYVINMIALGVLPFRVISAYGLSLTEKLKRRAV